MRQPEDGEIDLAALAAAISAHEDCWVDPDGGLLTQVLDACEMGQVDELAELIGELSCSIDAPGPDGDTALHLACLYGHVPCVELLLEKGAKAAVVNTDDGSTALHDAAASGHSDILKILLKEAPDMINHTDDDGDTPLHNAARGNHLDIVKILLEAGADPTILNMQHRTATRESDDKAVQDLLDQACSNWQG